MPRKLWTLALLRALLKPPLSILQDLIQGNGTSETERCNSTQIKLTHPPVRDSDSSFSRDTVRTPFPLAMKKDNPHISLVTVRQNFKYKYSDGKTNDLLSSQARESVMAVTGDATAKCYVVLGRKISGGRATGAPSERAADLSQYSGPSTPSRSALSSSQQSGSWWVCSPESH